MNLNQAIQELYKGNKVRHKNTHKNHYLYVKDGVIWDSYFNKCWFSGNRNDVNIFNEGWEIYTPPLLLKDLKEKGQRFKFKDSKEIHTILLHPSKNEFYYLDCQNTLWSYQDFQLSEVILVED